MSRQRVSHRSKFQKDSTCRPQGPPPNNKQRETKFPETGCLSISIIVFYLVFIRLLDCCSCRQSLRFDDRRGCSFHPCCYCTAAGLFRSAQPMYTRAMVETTLEVALRKRTQESFCKDDAQINQYTTELRNGSQFFLVVPIYWSIRQDCDVFPDDLD